ncbi:DNA mismatch endonuclease Vsr [uncultured Desulfuromonas sp.]|uniref:very short patch repair endonuclease n=1 Tax=uncultured Desulfuromonas sp. TaxID=181013 RepID=UPI002AAAFCDA|nr:DNA mismatch endonuclease Vsr [uncultured Desulfuromonas sp.]
MDTFSREKRSRIMSRIRSKDTKPEKIVRSLLHKMGYRFRLHRKDLPGKPDIVLPRLHKVIFVHGCFWHGHHDCKRSKRPTSNQSFWQKKLDQNIDRDKQAISDLKKIGWDVQVIWSCQVTDSEQLKKILSAFLTE